MMEPVEENATRYRALFECAQDGIFLFDADTGNFIEVNGAFLGMFGYSSEQIAQMSIFDLPEDSEENIRRNIQRVLQHGYWQLGERTYRCADGSLLQVEVYTSLLNLQNRRYIMEDTGGGIPPEHLPHIFEPFFTTKPVGRGTGLGLATVYGIVLAHGGGVEVRSYVGVGTCFRILLPALSETEDVPQTSNEPVVRRPFHAIRVLFVDDEAPIREMVTHVLRQEGYEVETASSGEEALQMIRERGTSYYRLLITDLTMPGLSGIELARQVCQMDPGLPVILCSGYGTEVAEQVENVPNVVFYLQKPYRRRQLLEAVEQALGG
ncbi:MAG: response regulator [Armatimonadota bacterium]